MSTMECIRTGPEGEERVKLQKGAAGLAACCFSDGTEYQSKVPNLMLENWGLQKARPKAKTKAKAKAKAKKKARAKPKKKAKAKPKLPMKRAEADEEEEAEADKEKEADKDNKKRAAGKQDLFTCAKAHQVNIFRESWNLKSHLKCSFIFNNFRFNFKNSNDI